MKRELLASFRLAREQRDKGNQQAALELLHDLTTKDPNSAAILAALGALCWDMQLWVDAVNAFREALRLSPKLEAASLGLFHCLWELGRREAAMAELKRFQALSDSEDYRRIVKAMIED